MSQNGQAALQRAFDEKDLLLVYQPIHRSDSREIWSAEALLRQRRRSGEIREASIITEAAEDGPAPELFHLDSWAMRTAYSDAAKWIAGDGRDVRLNVNLSPREFQEGRVLDRLTALIGQCGIDHSKVNLEITETSYIEEPEETMHVLVELKKLGIALWLDDFGTGHSSLTHLQHFPVDGIKLAGDFIKGVIKDKRSRVITQSVIRLAHELGLEIIAEGVEREEQRQFVLDEGCQYIQGFLFSRPMPLDEFERLLKKQC